MDPTHRRSLAWLLLIAACADYERPPRACEALGLLCVQEDVVYELGLVGARDVSGDLDGDGARELVSATAGGLAIAWGETQQRAYQLFPDGVPDVALGDVDGDGDLDVVFLTAEPPALRVLENRGTRTLVEGSTLALTGHVNDLWLGELDGDGTLDAIVAASENGRISVITGGLEDIENIVVGRDLAAVEAGDMNGDGMLDIVTLDRADAGIYISLANGAGFIAPRRTATGVRPEYLQLYDHDGDGELDVLTHGTGREIWFHPGDGAGGLGDARGLVVQDRASAGFMAHRDEQGHRWLVTLDEPDVVASRLGDDDQVVARTLSGGIRGYEQLGIDGDAPLVRGSWFGFRFSFASSQVFTEVERDAGFREHPIALADLDQDGELDLVSVLGDEIAVRRGLGDGTWGEPWPLVMAHPVVSLVVADVTGDGLLDLVIGDQAPALTVAVGAGDGTFTAGPPAPLDHLPSALHATADVPAAVVAAGPGLDQLGVTALRFDAAGAVGEQTQPLAEWSGGALASADVDGDGDDDLITLDPTPALVIVPRTADGWGPPASRSLADLSTGLNPLNPLRHARLVVGDIDLDGRFDAVLVTGDAVVRLLDIAADPAPDPQIDLIEDTYGLSGLALADIDGDGPLDLVTCGSTIRIFLFASDGETQPQAPIYPTVDGCILYVDPEDARVTAALTGDRGLSLLRPDLGLALVRGDTFQGGPEPQRSLVTGDIDADGHTDIVVSAASSMFYGSMAVLWGAADGAPRRASWQLGSIYDAELAVAPLDDVPGDDIVVAWSSGTTSLWTYRDGELAQRSGTQSPPFLPGGKLGGVGVQARGDERSDVIVLGFTGEEAIGVVALPRGDDGGLANDANVILWSGPVYGVGWSMAIADLDGDGYGDIAVITNPHSASGRVMVVWGDRERSGEVTDLEVPGMQRLSTADLDGDGAPELIADGMFGAASFAFTGRDFTVTSLLAGPSDALLAADLQNDGRADLLRIDGAELEITVRTGAGASDMRIPLDPPWTVMQAAHLDGDELLDLVGIRDGAVVTRLSADPAEVAP